MGLWGARAGSEFSRGHSPREDSHPWEHHLDQARDCKLEILWPGSSHWCVLFTQHLTKSMSRLSTVTLQLTAHSSTRFNLLYSLHPSSTWPPTSSEIAVQRQGNAEPLQWSSEVSMEWWVGKSAPMYSVQCSVDRGLAASPRPGESW